MCPVSTNICFFAIHPLSLAVENRPWTIQQNTAKYQYFHGYVYMCNMHAHITTCVHCSRSQYEADRLLSHSRVVQMSHYSENNKSPQLGCKKHWSLSVSPVIVFTTTKSALCKAISISWPRPKEKYSKVGSNTVSSRHSHTQANPHIGNTLGTHKFMNCDKNITKKENRMWISTHNVLSSLKSYQGTVMSSF